MEIAEGQRFPRQFVNAVAVVGGGALAFSLLRLPFAQVGFPLLLLVLLATHAAARFDRTDRQDGWRFPVADAFALLAMLLFDGEAADPAIPSVLADADCLLVSIPPDERGDHALCRFGEAVAAAPRLAWIGYLSTVGVYGDHGGRWVSEATPAAPVSERSRERVAAENGWLALGRHSGKSVHIFRLSGIYGPGRTWGSRRRPLSWEWRQRRQPSRSAAAPGPSPTSPNRPPCRPLRRPPFRWRSSRRRSSRVSSNTRGPS